MLSVVEAWRCCNHGDPGVLHACGVQAVLRVESESCAARRGCFRPRCVDVGVDDCF